MRPWKSSFPFVIGVLACALAVARCGSNDDHPAAFIEGDGTGGRIGVGGADAGNDAEDGSLGAGGASEAGPDSVTAETGAPEAADEAEAPDVSAPEGGLSESGTTPEAGSSCTPTAATEISCGDGVDNDCDGKKDCADPDCQPGGPSGTFFCDALGHTCTAPSPTGISTCGVCVLQGDAGTARETNCADHLDNDCDGKIDCDDEDCIAVQCGTSPSQQCQGNQCVDLDTGYTITLKPDRDAIPADGDAIDPITITVTANRAGLDVGNLPIQLFISGPGTWYGGDAGATTFDVLTNANGLAHATLLSSAAGGVAKVTGVVMGAGTGSTVPIDMPVVDHIVLADAGTFPMGVVGSGYNEANQMTFQVFGPNGVPYPAGLNVNFTLASIGNSTLGPPLAPVVKTDAGGQAMVTENVGDSGKVLVTVYAGTLAGTSSLFVSATGGGQTGTYTYRSVEIAGAKANGLHFSVQCSPQNLPALADTNCTLSLLALSTTCTTQAADRSNNVVSVGSDVSFFTEAGNIQGSATPDSKTGIASVQLTTGQAVLPLDVPPDPTLGEDSVTYDNDKCHDGIVHNPRDGVVTVIATMRGEEGFFDTNGNGKYDPGEPFVDLSEPYIDYNDNNQYDEGIDLYRDENENGQFDGPNGKWDADTTIWTATKIVFTSAATFKGSQLSRYSYYELPTLSGNTIAPVPSDYNIGAVNVPINAKVFFQFTDMNLNVLAPTTKVSTNILFPQGGLLTYTLQSQPVAPESELGFHLTRMYCPPDFNGDAGVCTTIFPGTVCTPSCTVGYFVSNFSEWTAGYAVLTSSVTGAFSVETTATTSATLSQGGGSWSGWMSLDLSGTAVVPSDAGP